MTRLEATIESLARQISDLEARMDEASARFARATVRGDRNAEDYGRAYDVMSTQLDRLVIRHGTAIMVSERWGDPLIRPEDADLLTLAD
jgi:hypothetical protein